MLRALKLGTLVVVASLLTGCLPIYGPSEPPPDPEAELADTLHQLDERLRMSPAVVDVTYDPPPLAQGAVPITVVMTEDAADAEWITAASEIATTYYPTGQPIPFEVTLWTDEALAISYFEYLRPVQAGAEITAGLELQHLLRTRVAISIRPPWNELHRTISVGGDDPALLAAAAASYDRLLDLDTRTTTFQTDWLLPGWQGFGELPPRDSISMAQTLARSLPAAAVEQSMIGDSFFVVAWNAELGHGIVAAQVPNGAYGSQPSWPAIVEAARSALASPSPFGFDYLIPESGTVRRGNITAAPCVGVVITEEDQAFASALAASGVVVPADRVGTCPGDE